MKIVLQDKATGLYVGKWDSWAKDVSRAMDFPSSHHALQHKVDQKLSNAELVFCFKEQGVAIQVPATPVAWKTA